MTARTARAGGSSGELEDLGELEGAAEAYGRAGDVQSEARVLARSGDVDRLGAVLGRSQARDREERAKRDGHEGSRAVASGPGRRARPRADLRRRGLREKGRDARAKRVARAR